MVDAARRDRPRPSASRSTRSRRPRAGGDARPHRQPRALARRPPWRPGRSHCCWRPCRGAAAWPGPRSAAGVAGLAFVALLNVPGGPLERLRSTPVLGRLAHLFGGRDQANAGDRARVLVWQGAWRLVRLPAPIVVPGRGPDGAASLRPVVGFGAETMQDVFGAVYDPAFEQAERRNPDISAEGVSVFSTRIPDRSHNETLDSLVTGGIAGARRVPGADGGRAGDGPARARPARRRAAAAGASRALCAGGAALLAVAAARLAFSWAYVGVALPLGLVGRLGRVRALAARCAAGPGRDDTGDAGTRGITAALLGHFVEIQFGPAVVTSRLYFWILAGLLVAAARGPVEDREARDGRVARRAPRPAGGGARRDDRVRLRGAQGERRRAAAVRRDRRVSPGSRSRPGGVGRAHVAHGGTRLGPGGRRHGGLCAVPPVRAARATAHVHTLDALLRRPARALHAVWRPGVAAAIASAPRWTDERAPADAAGSRGAERSSRSRWRSRCRRRSPASTPTCSATSPRRSRARAASSRPWACSRRRSAWRRGRRSTIRGWARPWWRARASRRRRRARRTC